MNNLKIAEWAGFRFCPDKIWVEDHDEPYEDGWLYPDGSWNKSLPNFSKSLNACEKWIWPKILMSQGYHFELRSPYKGLPYCFTIGKHGEHEAWTLYSGESDNPATAVCLACEKLIDEVK